MFESLKEISVFQADLIKSFAIFYLFVVINYIGPSLFPCYEINYINSHKWFQLIISFMLFYFLIILVSDTGKLEFTPPIEKLINSFFDRTRYYLDNKDVMNSIKTLEININKLKRENIIKSLQNNNIKIFKNYNNTNFYFIISTFLDRIFHKYYTACGFKT